MKCQQCESERVISVSGKTSDLCFVSISNSAGFKEHNGYVPTDIGAGGGDYLEIDFCLNCGQLQGEFPLPETKLEQQDNINK